MIAWSIATSGYVNDAYSYWSATGYGGIVNDDHAFLYTPPFLLAMQPLHLLPWDVFRLAFLAGQLAVLVWLCGPVIALLVTLPGPYSPVYTDLYFGNVMIFTAGLAVAGFRNPYWWAILPFMKVTPGVALLWDGWKPIALGLAVAVGSIAIVPALWLDWWQIVSNSTDAHPLAGFLGLRLALAVTLVLMGRWRGWAWTVPPAVALAQPVFWFTSLAILLGWVYQLRHDELRLPSATPALRRALSRP